MSFLSTARATIATAVGSAGGSLAKLAAPVAAVGGHVRGLLGDHDRLLGKADIDPGSWTAPPAPGLTGVFAPNNRLAGAEFWPAGGNGPEDVLVDDAGNVYTGLEDGSIVRYPAGGGTAAKIARVNGRPLGLEWLGDNLLVCSSSSGLLEINPKNGRVRPLLGEFEGVPFKFCNNAAVQGDGTIWFTDSSTKFGFDDFYSDIFEHQPNGRLFRYDIVDHAVELVDDGLYFANGVALAADESYVLYAETGQYRINRRWLTGPAAGTKDVFAENLPGLPDNLSTGPTGTIWAALVTPRDAKLDQLLPRPGLRKAVYLLPDALRPDTQRHGFVLGFDQRGEVTHNLQDPRGGFAEITGVREHNGFVYLGSLHESGIARARL